MSKDTDKPDLRLLSKEALKNLTAEEAKELRKIFGVDIDNTPNLEQIIKQFVETRKRIREIEEKALQKLNKRGGDDDPSAA